MIHNRQILKINKEIIKLFGNNPGPLSLDGTHIYLIG